MAARSGRSGLLVATLVALVSLSAWGAAWADITVPRGFTVQLYASGDGFEMGNVAGAGGFPTTTTAAFDQAGMLYLARTGRRYAGGEVDDLWPIYRVPPGGARLTPATERRFLHGPPLWSAQVSTGRAGRDVFVTSFDRDRSLGVVYRLVDGRAELLAGGTPPPGARAQLGQPEGVTADSAGNVYVADRLRGVVIKLDPAGRVVDPRYASVGRPRLLAVDEADQLWIGADAGNEAPWRGPSELWKVPAAGKATRVLSGPNLAGMGFGSGGRLFIADRQAAKIFFVTPDGTAVDFAAFTDGDLPRTLCFAPVTADTRRAGIAGDLFLVAVRRGVFRLNEVLRVTGPFDELPGKPSPPR